jgi:hypothetical protein
VRGLGVAGALLLGALLTTGVVRQSLDPATANHDVAWTLYAGAQLLDGAVYGVDVIELNPPLILWATTGVAAVARLAGAPPVLTYNLLVLLLVLGFCLALWRLLRGAYARPESAGAIAVLMATALVLLPGYEFGQREQLIFLLATPHLLLAALSVEGDASARRGARSLAGAAMATAVAMKPPFALAWLGVEGIMGVRAGRLRAVDRPENRAAVAVLLLYGACIALFASRYLEVLADALAVLPAYERPLAIFDRHTVPAFAALAATALLRPRGAAGRCTLAAIVASAAGFAALWVQGKGYVYHYQPFQLWAVLALACAGASRLERATDASARADPLRPRVGLAACGIAALAMSVVALARGVEFRDPDRRDLMQVIEEYGRGEPVLFFSSSVTPAFPVLTLSGSRHASPYPCLWQIAGSYSAAELARPEFPYRRHDALTERERRVVAAIVGRMERQRPALLFFDRARYKPAFRGAWFAFEIYFRADPRFSELMRGYRPLGTVGTYFVYVRDDAG